MALGNNRFRTLRVADEARGPSDEATYQTPPQAATVMSWSAPVGCPIAPWGFRRSKTNSAVKV
jgi:hypothetical protein